ncbi:MAG: AraC family transcriptional regulator ligand-binding domain-containing protein [Deltaproteobacteria bacterium]|nr:AraC family transcriptional regulator ligand-binding domain-containing protein [Deltaproteobacteria bacterium]
MDVTQGISVALLRPLAELLGRLDIDGAAFLAGLGIDEQMAPNTYVSALEVDRRLAEIAAQRGDPAFALTLAKTSVVRPLGLFGHLVWLSGTLRDALERAVKFYAMVTRRTTLVLEERGAIATIRSRPVDNAPRGRILTEFPFASLALRARGATDGVFAARAVRFTHAGEPTPAYDEVFRAPVTFGASIDELELDVAQLDLKLASADPITSAAIEAQVAQLTAAPPGNPVLDRVRRAVVASLPEVGSPDAIAKQLGISARTLRRQLEQQGQTLRALVDDVRRTRADELLAAGRSIKDVAFELGFSEPSAFSRAYKRWTGKAPSSA